MGIVGQQGSLRRRAINMALAGAGAIDGEDRGLCGPDQQREVSGMDSTVPRRTIIICSVVLSGIP